VASDRIVTNTNWYLDSEASGHMTPHQNILQNFRPGNFPEIATANNQKLKMASSGAIVSIDGVDIQMEEVPQLSANLLSVTKIAAAGNKVQFDGIDCRIYSRGQKLLQARARNGGQQCDRVLPGEWRRGWCRRNRK